MHKKSIYQNRNMTTTILLFVLGALMLGFSVYLIQHYFDIKFPTGLEGKALCNLNQFFNCDKTSLSIIGNFFGVPLGVFGSIIGALVLGGLLFKNQDYERTIYFTLAVNFAGCLLLLCYSLFVLKGLCLFCTFYYIISGLTLYYFTKKSPTLTPSVKYLAYFSIVVLIIAGLVKNNVDTKIKAQNEVATDLIKQYFALPNLGNPAISSEFKIATAPRAPIKMVIFSDFECPACKAFSEQIPLIVANYEGRIDIEYFYYPLDMSCNPAMERPLHQFACKASYAASCMPLNSFFKTHEVLFHNQEKFDSGFVDQYIKENHLEACVNDPKTKEKVQALIKASTPFNIRSTPTYLINGVKIEGVIPANQLFSIFDEIIKRSKK